MATCGDAARSCRPSGTAARCDPAPERPAEQPESTCSRVPRNVGSRRPHCRRLRLIGAQLKEPILAPVARTVGVNGSAARAIIGGAPVTNSPLTASQIEAYTRDGALLVSGLIAPELCRAAADAMWQQMGAAPRPLAQDRWALKDRPQPRREDRSTWPVGALSDRPGSAHRQPRSSWAPELNLEAMAGLGSHVFCRRKLGWGSGLPRDHRNLHAGPFGPMPTLCHRPPCHGAA
eukprot:SAG31_NODE_1511_length_8060_cov_3.005653_8_plen_233_part_00